jgi:MFS family permease
MLTLTTICLGQAFSLLGTAMTGFALAVWAWQITGQATALALVGFFAFAPLVLASPFAGALVDRWNRKATMILSDLAAASSTAVVLFLYATGSLQIWHLYVSGAFTAVFQAFHFPAYSAAVTTIVPKEHYGRASGMLSLAQSASGIFAPMFGVVLLGVVGVAGVLAADLVTCFVAVGVVLLARIPKPTVTSAGLKGRGSIWREAAYGFRYIGERRSLLNLLLVFFVFNLVITFSLTLLNPMILTSTGNNVVVLGSVQSAAGIGGVIGSLFMSAWGGPKRRVNGILMAMLSASLFGVLLMGLRVGPFVWVAAAFSLAFVVPIANGSSQALWQTKVAPNVQGRVFSTRLLISQISVPVSTVLSGVLADAVFEPAMRQGGGLVPVFGWLVGSDTGSGMALMFVITGALGAMISLGAYAFPSVRNAEDILPDYDAAALQNLGTLKPAQTATPTVESGYQESDRQTHAPTT